MSTSRTVSLLLALAWALPASGSQDVPLAQRNCRVVTVLDHGPPPAPAPAGAPLALSVTFDPNITAAQQAVCLQAVADWQARVEFGGQLVAPYPLHLENGPLGGSTLAQATTTWNSPSFVLLSSVIRIDNDGSSQFFVDPTPWESSEFDSSGSCIQPACQSSDLLTVMRHEIGHAIGWTGFFAAGGLPPNSFPGSLMSGATFDPSRLNVPCDAALTSHSSATAFPATLMNPAIAAGTRIGIADYPDLAVIGRAYQHGVRIRFVDSTPAGTTLAGTATNPYISLKDVEEQSAPAGFPIVIADGSYFDSILIMRTPHLYTCAWNGTALVQ